MPRSLVRRACTLVGIALTAAAATPASSLATNTPESAGFTLTPSHGVAGDVVTISGTGAASLHTVGFLGSGASDAHVVPGQDAIALTVPPRTSPNAQATISSFEHAIVATFTYDDVPTPAPVDPTVLPSITSVAPKVVSPKTGGLLTIRGVRLRGANAVTVRGAKVPFIALGDVIYALAPKVDIPGGAAVAVHTSRGWSPTTAAAVFQYLGPASAS